MLTTTGELFYIYYFPTLTFDQQPDGSATTMTRTTGIAASQSQDHDIGELFLYSFLTLSVDR